MTKPNTLVGSLNSLASQRKSEFHLAPRDVPPEKDKHSTGKLALLLSVLYPEQTLAFLALKKQFLPISIV